MSEWWHGKMLPLYEITCARAVQCATSDIMYSSSIHEDSPLMRQTPTEFFRELGWRYRRGEGWICPGCTGKEQDDSAAR